jgi:3-deoxy-manno-octulosonate cytidylyltransferase (CMP-KDO synthetase)
VCATDGRALYFSRSPIPHWRDVELRKWLDDPNRLREALGSPHGREPVPFAWLLHIGLYAYRRDFLLKLTELPLSPLERLEKLEQLRALEAGAIIQVATVEHRSVGIDTPEDYAAFVARQKKPAA